MKDEAKKRLEGFLQDLQEIEEASPIHIRCAFISSKLTSPLHDITAWQRIAEFFQANTLRDRLIVVGRKPILVEPFDDNKGCIRWRGPASKRKEQRGQAIFKNVPLGCFVCFFYGKLYLSLFCVLRLSF